VILALGLAAASICAVVMLQRRPRRLANLAVLQAAIAVLSIPLAGELRTFYATRSAHTFIGLPSEAEVVGAFIPCSLAGALILLTWICLHARSDIRFHVSRRGAVLIGCWALFTPLFLYLLGIFTDLRLFVMRYCSSALPGQALLAGALLGSISSSAVRRTLIVLTAVIAVLAQGRLVVPSHNDDDWRDAMAFVRSQAGSSPVLLVSPFAEATDFKALDRADLRDVLFAPVLEYGAPRNSIRLPHLFPFREIPALESATAPLAHARAFYLVNDKPDTNYLTWLTGRLGCRSEITGSRFGYVWIAHFTCG